MKKYIFIIGSALLLILFFIPKNDLKYDIGRDTHDYFGDGKYQTFKSDGGVFQISNRAEQLSFIDYDVYKYKKIGTKVYIIGQIGYSILDYKNDTLKQYLDYKYLRKEDLESYNQFDKKVKDDYYKSRLTYLNNYSDFTNQEKKIFKEMKVNRRKVNYSF